ncbi:hypothetical protein LXL04_003572 [Taraxacum kok-saghyz]
MLLEPSNTNPGNTIRIDVQPESNYSNTTRVFRRTYVCLGALKFRFQEGMRYFLGFDRTFMKGSYLGQILMAVGIDSNNGMYPLVYVVVEVETIHSWTSFLDLLGEDLNLGPRSNFTFISVTNIFPNAEHRYFFRHIQENLKKINRDKEVSDQVWKCGRAMAELKEINEKVKKDLSQIPPPSWYKAHSSETHLFEVIKKDAERYTTHYNGAAKYQVGCPWENQFVVNLNDNNCTCRTWEITDAAIWDMIANREDTTPMQEYVHPCYRTTTWRAMYFNKINPINGRSMWPKSDSP